MLSKMEENKLVSIILTTYKRKPEMVKRAIDSALNQTYRNLELIIVDDSPDSYELRKDVASMIYSISDNRLIYIKHKMNRGACVARNTGIEKSNGEYIMYFDDDDELLPDKVFTSIEQFHSQEIGLVYSQNYVIDQYNNKILKINPAHSGYVFDELIKGNFVLAFPLIRRECFDKCGLFDEKMLSMQDYEMWLRIAEKYKFEHVAKPLSNVYHHKEERISTNIKKKIQGAQEINSRYYEYLNENPIAKNVRLMKLAKFYALGNEFKKSTQTWINATTSRPFNVYSNLRYSLTILKSLFK